MGDFIPAQTGLSRVFIIEGRARPDHAPEYQSCMRGQALSKSFGDVTDIECPDPNRPGAYVKIGEVQAGDERATLTLEGRYAIDMRSRMLQLAQRKCALDVQLHFGDCEDLSNHNNFKKILFLEDARLLSYDTEDLGSLQSADSAPINETVELSATTIYDIIKQSYSQKADDVVTTEVVDVVFCDEISCGECEDESTGCEKWYAVTIQAGGSPGTPPDVVFSIDDGITWYADDIDTLGAAEDPTAVGCVMGYLVVTSNDTNSVHIVDLDELNGETDPVFEEVDDGFVAGGEPNDIASVGTKAWIVGDFGYVYVMTDPTAGVTVQDAGVATVSVLNAVDALNSNVAVAVGHDGVVIFTEDGETWQVTGTNPVGPGVHLDAVAVKTKEVWFVGDDNGFLWYTLDGGLTWSLKAFTGDGNGSGITDIDFATDSIGYLSQITDDPIGRILATYNGGYDWVVMPLGDGVMPETLGLNAVAACTNEPELVVAVGLGENLDSDGIIILGSM